MVEDGEFHHLTCKPTLTIKASDGSHYVDLDTIMFDTNPILQVSQSISCLKDIQAEWLFLNGITTIKDSGTILVVQYPNFSTELQEKSGYSPQDDYTHLFCTKISPIDRTTVLSDPQIATDYAFFVEKDVQTFGFYGTSSDPHKGAGGGAIMMGQGFTGFYGPPMFTLTGLLGYPSDSNFPANPFDGQWFYKTGANAGLYRYVNSQWVLKVSCSQFGSYPSGTNLPGSPELEQWFYKTDTKELWQYTKISQPSTYGWRVRFSNVQSEYYDTLFLFKADTSLGVPHAPANLHLGSLTATESVWCDSLTVDDNVYFGAGLSNAYLSSQCSGPLRFKHTSGQTMYIRPDENGSIIFFENPPAGPQNIYLKTLAATAGTTLQDSSSLTFVGKYWTGAASNDRYATIKHAMLSTAPTSELQVTIGATQIGAWQSSGRLELPVNGASGGLRIGDVSLYRDSAYTLRLQNNLIVEGDAWASNLAVDNVIGTTGNVIIGSCSSPAKLSICNTGSSDNVKLMAFDKNADGVEFVLYGMFASSGETGNYLKIATTWHSEILRLYGSGKMYLTTQGSSGGLVIGDVSLYRDSAYTLRLQNNLIVEGDAWCNDLAVDNNIGVIGNIDANGCIHGGGSSGNAFKIGDDCYLVDINQANVIGVRGAYDSNIGGFRLGNSTWTQLKNSGAILYFQTYTSTGGILPSTGGYYTLGSSSNDWSYVYANYLRYDVNCVEYDALDDLALVKNHKSKNIIDKESGEEITVIDMKESFPFLLADDNHIAHEKLQGYMLGCVKALVMRVEALENQLKQNQTPA